MYEDNAPTDLEEFDAAPEETPEPAVIPNIRKSLVEVAEEVNEGVWGADEETQRANLFNAGYNAKSILQEADLQKNPNEDRKSIRDIADEVELGLHGEGHELARNLIQQGYSVSRVIAEVSRRS